MWAIGLGIELDTNLVASGISNLSLQHHGICLILQRKEKVSVEL